MPFKSGNLMHTAAMLAIVAFSPLSAHAQAIFSPLAVPINTGGNNSTIGNTIDHSGLFTDFTSGVTDFDTYIASNPLHTKLFSPYEWFSQNGLNACTLVYDLGAGASVDRLALWNEETIGVGSMSVDASDDLTFGSGVTNLGTFLPTDNSDSIDYGAEVFTLAPTSARYVRLQLQAPTGQQVISMGEIAFRSAVVTAVPEPGTMALALPALTLAGTILIRRKK